MKIFRKLAVLTFVLAILFAISLPGIAYASGYEVTLNTSQNHSGLPDQFVFGDTYTLHNGDTLVGDLFILGGTVTLEQGSVVQGSVVLVGGTLAIQGIVEKDLVALGGTPTLESSGHINGDAVTIGSRLSGATGNVSGKIVTDIGSVFQIRSFNGQLPTVGVARVPFLWGFLSLSFSVFFMTALAIGTVLLLPKQAEQTAKVLVRQPVASGGMGCLTVIVAPIILLALAITIILSPVSLLGAVLLVALVLFGWVAIGLELGNRLAKALHTDWHPAVSAGVGTFGLTLVALGLSRVIICVGWMVPFLVSMVALGSVILVFFGADKTLKPAPVVIQPANVPPAVVPTGMESPPESPPQSSDQLPPSSG
jgi:hypothetical protein